ncbi:methyltransferase [Nocardioides sp. zg-579]|uniref:Methyltransferase n=1 Tax=Nocardioides marmotae TaxID=2663857 RepID=A0A6I3JG62_9ACTN|nr:class I SAM-dependent methyltransferase [Nocardioides marmotae]MCR6033271.1 methyltransferase [Gordonia jinghuaiqii]MTB96928.1 methyltransferase [Nocardioides marmotae]QKE00687.1 class I SAM-dependent methyltransferase [Nocardioides marmotae]
MTPDHGTATGEQIAFGPLTITFDERVLRPRAWTAAQSEWAAQLLRDAPAGPVLELCAGAGQIGLLAVHDEDRQLVCVDANPVACAYTLQNAAAAGLGDRVEVRNGDLSAMVGDDERYALVVADPPWVPAADTGRFPEDPRLAIDGGTDGTVVAVACVEVAAGHLPPGGSLLLQLGNVEQVDTIAATAGAAHGMTLDSTRVFERGVVARFVRG